MSSNIVDLKKYKEETEEESFWQSLNVIEEQLAQQMEDDILERMYAVHSTACKAIEAGKTLDQVNEIIEQTSALYCPDEEDDEEIEE